MLVLAGPRPGWPIHLDTYTCGHQRRISTRSCLGCSPSRRSRPIRGPSSRDLAAAPAPVVAPCRCLPLTASPPPASSVLFLPPLQTSALARGPPPPPPGAQARSPATASPTRHSALPRSLLAPVARHRQARSHARHSREGASRQPWSAAAQEPERPEPPAVERRCA
jgi:hypothetical protein